MKRGLFLGRFQPLHKGHVAAIRESAAKVGELYIGIGSATESDTERNPFSGEERVEMLGAAVGDLKNIKVIQVPDIPGRDDEWVKYLEDRYPKFDVIFTGNPYTRNLFEEKGYEVVSVTMIPNVSGTQIREMIRGGRDWRVEVLPEVAEILTRINAVDRLV